MSARLCRRLPGPLFGAAAASLVFVTASALPGSGVGGATVTVTSSGTDGVGFSMTPGARLGAGFGAGTARAWISGGAAGLSSRVYIGCAISFAVHIVLLAELSPRFETSRLNAVQLLVVGITCSSGIDRRPRTAFS